MIGWAQEYAIKKFLKSPQWLRNKRFLRRGFIRKLFFKKKIIPNGGWHFSFLKKTRRDCRLKMKSYGHGELNHKADIKSIETSIKSKKFFINENIKLNTVKIDETYPDYVRKNQNILKDWII